MFKLKGLAIAGACALLAGTTTMAAVARPAHVASVAPDFVADVVGPYLAIQTALVNDELGPIAAAAKALRTAADSLGADGKVLASAAGRIGDATSLDAARAAFADLSVELIAYADRTKQPVEGKIVAFCPMANKSWVQADGAIANPYYGKAMATCGSATRKLAPTQ